MRHSSSKQKSGAITTEMQPKSLTMFVNTDIVLKRLCINYDCIVAIYAQTLKDGICVYKHSQGLRFHLCRYNTGTRKSLAGMRTRAFLVA